MRLDAKVTPRSSRPMVSWDGSTVSVWVAPPAVDGRATEAALLMVAKWLGLRPTEVKLVSGTTSRYKVLEVPDGVQLPED